MYSAGKFTFLRTSLIGLPDSKQPVTIPSIEKKAESLKHAEPGGGGGGGSQN